MDAETLRVLDADLASQTADVARVYAKVHQRMEGFQESEERCEALGFQLHNLYCAFEDLFRLIADAFENKIGNGGSWRVQALSRMREDIPGVRPRLIDEEAYRNLNELRAFRHVFRHAYATKLEPDKLAVALRSALKLEAVCGGWVSEFLRTCRERLRAERPQSG